MEWSASRKFLVLVWSLVLLGVVLLCWWMFAVSAYGYEVDEKGLVGTVRSGDVILFAAGVLSLIAAAALPILRRRRIRRTSS